VSWYRKAADDHHLSHAQCALGWRYARGEGVAAVDLGQAAHWFELAALQGHCEAMSALGCLLLSATDLKLREIALPPPPPLQQQQQQQPSSKTEASDGSPTSTPPLTKVDASSARTSCGLAWLERGAALGDESSSVALQRARASLASLDLLEKMARGPHREHIPDNR
jgi:TPR repeat protein